MSEILELARAQANFREKTQFLDAYIPTFQQFMPLLQQLISNVNRRANDAKPSLRHPTDTSLARLAGQPAIVNTFGFPKALQNAIPTDPQMSGRRLDLVQMFGASNSSTEGAYATIRFTLKGLNLTTGEEETYEVDFALDVEVARRIAFYLERLADDTDHNHIRFVATNIELSHQSREAVAQAQTKLHPKG